MNNAQLISDEQLNAFIDNELDAAEWTELVAAIRDDAKLAARVCELRQLKDMMQVAYRQPPQPDKVRRATKTRSRSKPKWWPLSLVAGLTLAFTATVSGWLAHSFYSGEGGQTIRLAQTVPHVKGIVIHIATGDADRVKAALDEAEALLTEKRTELQNVKLEIVANADGVSLLQNETSPHAARIRQMAKQYENLTFLACSRSLEKLRLKGEQVHLIPEVEVIPGALEAIVSRVQDGWVYIKV